MDTGQRDLLISKLYQQLRTSIFAAIKASREWSAANERINAAHPGADSRIVKGQSLEMKDAMSSYVWHRDHANFCANMIQLLLKEGEIYGHAGVPQVSVEDYQRNRGATGRVPGSPGGGVPGPRSDDWEDLRNLYAP